MQVSLTEKRPLIAPSLSTPAKGFSLLQLESNNANRIEIRVMFCFMAIVLSVIAKVWILGLRV